MLNNKFSYCWGSKEVLKVKIKSLEVYGFGKWIDKKIDPLQQLQLFYGENEAGKTTLMAFIHSILFGFPTKQSSELRYEPKNSSQYGGRLVVSDTPFGEVIIERIKGKANGEVTVTLANGEVGSDALLEKIVNGIDKATYQALFSFNLFGLQKIQQMNRTKLNRYFLSVGTLGNEQLLKVADKFQLEAGKLYKQTGRVPEINQKIKQVEAKRKQVRFAKEKNDEYTTLYTQKEAFENEIVSLRKRSVQAEERLEQLNHLATNWNHFSEMLLIQQELSQLTLAELPEDGLYQLNHLNQAIEQVRIDIMQENERSKHLKEKSKLTQSQQLYLTHKESIQELFASSDNIKAMLQEKEFIERDIQKETNLMVRDKLQLGLNIGQSIPPAQTPEQKRAYQLLYQKTRESEEKKQEAAEKTAFLQYQNESLSTQLDKIEPLLWDKATLQQVEESHQKKAARSLPEKQIQTTVPSANKKLLTAGSGILVGLFASFSGLFLSNGFSLFLVGFGLLLVISSLFLAIKKPAKNKLAKTEPAVAYTYEDYIKQIELRKQWRDKLAEIDQVAVELKQATEKSEIIRREQQENQEESHRINEQNGYPSSFLITDLVKKGDLFDSLRERNKAVEEKEKQLEQLNEKLVEWKAQVDFLEPVIFVDWRHLPAVLSGFLRFYQEAKGDEQALAALSKKEEEHQEQLKQWVYKQRELENQRNDLFRSVKAKNEQDFRKNYVLFEERKQKQARLALLKQQVSEDISLLEQYRDRTDLLEDIEKTRKQIQQYKKTEEQQINQKIKCEVALNELEKGGAYSVLLQEYANLKSELQELVNKWASYRVAAELIERALTHARKDRFPETLQDTTEFFKLLTNERYQQVFVKDDKIEVQRQDGTIFDATELSQGTAEQLYVALRFAFVKNASDIVQLPLMIDDGFVNFDQDRKSQMIELMKRMSEKTQIFYFTFDKEALSNFRKEQIEMLY